MTGGSFMIPYVIYSTFMGFFVFLIGIGVDLLIGKLQSIVPLSGVAVISIAISMKLLLFWAYMKQTQMIYVKFFRHYQIPYETPPFLEKSLLNLSQLGLFAFHYHACVLVIDYFQITWGSMFIFICATSLLLGVTIQKWNQSIYRVNVTFIKVSHHQ